MRQGDGSDLLGSGNPQSSDVGIIYVDPADSRLDILKGINIQEELGRKQIAIVLPAQHKAFRQPIDFDGLKAVRRGLKAQLIFIAPAGPGPAEFARQRRFVVYSSLETFAQALAENSSPAPADERPRGLFGGGRKPKANPPAQPPPQNQSSAAAQGRPLLPAVIPVPMPAENFEAGRGQVPPGAPSEEPPARDPVEINQAAAQKPDAGPGSGTPPSNDEDDEDYYLAPIVPLPTNPAMPTPLAPGTARGSAPTGPMREGKQPRPLALPGVPLSGVPSTPHTTGKMSTVQKTPGESGSLPAVQSATASEAAQPLLMPPPASGSSSKPGRNIAPLGNQSRKSRPPLIAGGVPFNSQASTPAASGGTGAAASSNTTNGNNQPADPNRKGNTGQIVAVGAGAALGAGLLAGSAVAHATSSSAPANSTSAATAGRSSASTATPPLTPLPPPRSRIQRRRWRRNLLALLILLALSIVLLALIFGPRVGMAQIFPGSVSAQISITPDSQLIQNNFLVVGTTAPPNPAKMQVAARVISTQSQPMTATGQSTGSIAATQASGVLVFQNVGENGVQLSGGTLTGGDGVQVSFGAVYVPAVSGAEVTGTAVIAGSSGNIPASDINGTCCGNTNIHVKNLSAFTGGHDAILKSVVQKADIDSTAAPLKAQLTTTTQAALHTLMKSNERAVDSSLACPATTQSDYAVNARAPSFTVTVMVKCSEVVYNYQAAQQNATTRLQNDSLNNPQLTQYKLAGQIVSTPISATVVSADNQVSIYVQAQGLWVYDITPTMQHNLIQSLAKLSKKDALSILSHQVGVKSAQITLSTGDTLPTNVADIHLNVQTPPGIQTTTPGAGTPGVAGTPSAGTPGAGNNGTPTNPGASGPTPTHVSGGVTPGPGS